MSCEKHDAVHFNRGDKPHVWICMTCKKRLLGGDDLTNEDIEGLASFMEELRKTMKDDKKN